jgi:hypothetical protein
MSTEESKKLEFTDTGYIENVKDAFRALDSYFGQLTKKGFSDSRKKSDCTLHFFLLFD